MSQKPKVYSYLRFSRPEQAEGDSLRRQTATSYDKAKAIAVERGFDFDESLSVGDRGLSAYSGAHRKRGMLGHFLEQVKAGTIPAGSILVVENIDRLSRLEPIDAIDMILMGIIKHGISIVTDTATYDRDSLRGGLIYLLIGEIMRAHAESRAKSERLSQAWKQKRENARNGGQILTAMKPSWLKLDVGRFTAIPEAVRTLQLIFELKRKGIGADTIAKRLNDEAPWSPPANPKRKGSGWRGSYIQKILRDRAVLGEYQPHRKVDGKRIPDGDPIPNYFPAVVPPELFHAVQAQLAKNRGTGGRTGKVSNLLTHLVRCAYCGGPMHFVDKGKPPKGAQYLVCDNARRGRGCKMPAIRYDEVERLILENCHKLRPEHVLPDQDEQAIACMNLRERITGGEAQVVELESRLDVLAERISRAQTTAIGDRLEAMMVELEKEKAELANRLAADKNALRDAETSARSLSNWKAGLAELHAQMAKSEPELRLRLRTHLRDLIARIDCFTRGHEHEFEVMERLSEVGCCTVEGRKRATRLAHPAEDIAQRVGDICAAVPRRQRATFGAWVTARRMSRHGRFIRVKFKTGALMDLVPTGSIADGVRLADEGGWEFVRPDLDHLWRQFKKANPRDFARG